MRLFPPAFELAGEQLDGGARYPGVKSAGSVRSGTVVKICAELAALIETEDAVIGRCGDTSCRRRETILSRLLRERDSVRASHVPAYYVHDYLTNPLLQSSFFL